MNINKKPSYTTNNNKRSFRKPTLKDKLEKVPEHIRNIVYVLNNNAEIRRFTSLTMINKLREENAISDNDKVYSDNNNKASTEKFHRKYLERYKPLYKNINLYYNMKSKDYGVKKEEIALRKIQI